jgi:hypothetical protein
MNPRIQFYILRILSDCRNNFTYRFCIVCCIWCVWCELNISKVLISMLISGYVECHPRAQGNTGRHVWNCRGVAVRSCHCVCRDVIEGTGGAATLILSVSTNGGAWSASAGLPPSPVKCETDLTGHRTGRDVVEKRKTSFACRKSNHDSAIVQNRVELCSWSFCTGLHL